jgi:hypothetical protein
LLPQETLLLKEGKSIFFCWKSLQTVLDPPLTITAFIGFNGFTGFTDLNNFATQA